MSIASTTSRERQSKRQIMHDLLGRLGEDKILLEEFWRRLKQNGLTADDIDRYLDGTL